RQLRMWLAVREVQRVLATQRGPVNWETALQVARAVSSTGAAPVAGDGERAAFEGACRIAELGVLQATGLDPSPHLTSVEVLDRTAWAHVTLGELRPVLERLGTRLGGQFGATGLPLPLRMFADALAPFYLGIQFGFFTGCLSWRALGRFDLCLPPARPCRHRLVPQNLALMERDLGVDGRQLRMWLAVREVVHDLTFQSVPWAAPLVKGLVADYVDAAGVDVPAVLARLQELPPEDLTRVAEHPEDLFTLLATPAQEAIGARLKVAVSVIQGHAEWAIGKVGAGLLPELAKIREGATRRWVERSAVERLFARVLGIDLDPADLRAGERFVREVAEAGRLADLWRTVANVPTPDELEKPAAWLERMGSG
ncbi:MAG: zinc-dependent metalloprotease, partial [Actinomycetota bacterium]